MITWCISLHKRRKTAPKFWSSQRPGGHHAGLCRVFWLLYQQITNAFASNSCSFAVCGISHACIHLRYS